MTGLQRIQGDVMQHDTCVLASKASRFGFAGILVLLLGLANTGCTNSKPQRQPVQDAGTSPLTAPISNTDPCAMQMHDITGAFLLFYASENRLPNQLSELYSTNFLERDVRFVCPASQQPYVYNPGGIFMPEQNARVILYDATSAHSGFRWAITIHEPQPGQPLVAKVIALPDQFFILQH